MRQMILRGPDIHPGVNYVVRGIIVELELMSEVVSSTLDSDVTILSEQETTQRFDLNAVLPAPNFLPGLVVNRYEKKEGDMVEYTYSVNEDATIANLKEKMQMVTLSQKMIPEAIMHHRWKWELANPDEPFPEHLEVYCPHCGSPDNEWGERTRVEDPSFDSRPQRKSKTWIGC